MVANYDNFYLAPPLTDAWVSVVLGVAERYDASATRYTTSFSCASSSLMRLRLSDQLARRGLAPHVDESCQEAELARQA